MYAWCLNVCVCDVCVYGRKSLSRCTCSPVPFSLAAQFGRKRAWNWRCPQVHLNWKNIENNLLARFTARTARTASTCISVYASVWRSIKIDPKLRQTRRHIHLPLIIIIIRPLGAHYPCAFVAWNAVEDYIWFDDERWRITLMCVWALSRDRKNIVINSVRMMKTSELTNWMQHF